ncbi:PepSY domain-containing protein [Fortiea contorta]|uniref:PepSY domain-containing protein n=1 Tax=Fortiea contorta TaxID=1892405 RepID=UPI0003602C2E|nr:PepSY-associated TM helix domain-containing protein [Fortiea contorta]
MNTKIIRNTAFQLHRWLGLVGGVLLCIAGLTGSVLVFWHEIDEIVLGQHIHLIKYN